MVPYGVKTIWFQMPDPHKQSIPAAWTPHENHTASRHMVSGGATPTAPKRLGIWDHKGRPTIWCFADRSAAGPADQIKKEPYGRALAGGSVISWAAPTIRCGTIWWEHHMVEPSSGRGRPAAPGGGRFIPETHEKASTEVHEKTGIRQHTGEFGFLKSGLRLKLLAQK